MAQDQFSTESLTATDASGSDRRRGLRHPCDVPVTCRPLDRPTAAWAGRLRDVSPTGLGLTLERCLRRGTLLTVEVPSALAEGPLSFCACVIHATPLPEGGFLIGCALDSPLSEVQLQLLLLQSPTVS